MIRIEKEKKYVMRDKVIAKNTSSFNNVHPNHEIFLVKIWQKMYTQQNHRLSSQGLVFIFPQTTDGCLCYLHRDQCLFFLKLQIAKSTCSSTIEPEIEPIAQHNVFKLFQLQSSPLNCLFSFLNIWIKQNEETIKLGHL